MDDDSLLTPPGVAGYSITEIVESESGGEPLFVSAIHLDGEHVANWISTDLDEDDGIVADLDHAFGGPATDRMFRQAAAIFPDAVLSEILPELVSFLWVVADVAGVADDQDLDFEAAIRVVAAEGDLDAQDRDLLGRLESLKRID
ncbi:hypothetical protein ACR8AL_04650 [Clavibacter sepedonicus]|nr:MULTISPECIES: hypothetical protein [Clavibacter]MBD5383272.1 hypothetical protein [Clavibacter sp.]OQJ49447.1 hypothetical protein B5P19_01765 [Clavibacter sepedonicus]OQJ55338.1 hypothetical protein B5P20_00030 [Clavibacter sepedonicus]OQJ55575.1 hypothetical protein B5P20_15455 [Clavibacter sepedonicus]UUK66691.1 hypothetical protein LRE50_05630 [Clavibacter sepedonicus]